MLTPLVCDAHFVLNLRYMAVKSSEKLLSTCKAKHIIYHFSENCDMLTTTSNSNFGMSVDEKAAQLVRVALKKIYIFVP